MSFTPLINGIEHAWSDIEVRIFGQKIAGIKAVNYKEPRKKINVMGAGNRPVSRSRGAYEPEASIQLLLTELLAVQKAAPGGDITRIPPFDIIVAYLPQGSSQQVTETLHNAEFVENSRSLKTGDTEFAIDLPLVISHVTWGQ